QWRSSASNTPLRMLSTSPPLLLANMAAICSRRAARRAALACRWQSRDPHTSTSPCLLPGSMAPWQYTHSPCMPRKVQVSGLVAAEGGDGISQARQAALLAERGEHRVVRWRARFAGQCNAERSVERALFPVVRLARSFEGRFHTRDGEVRGRQGLERA